MKTISRGWSWMALVATGALVFAGFAVANHVGASTHAVSATFSATTVAERWTRTCTGVDGTYELTHAKYTGTATGSDDRLSGAIELHVRSVYNQSENLGRVHARVKIRDDAGKVKTRGELHAVNANGQVEGLLVGHAREGVNNKLLANVSAAYTSEGGFSNGQLGAGNAANTALLYANGCGSVKKSFKVAKAHKAEHARDAKDKKDRTHHRR